MTSPSPCIRATGGRSPATWLGVEERIGGVRWASHFIVCSNNGIRVLVYSYGFVSMADDRTVQWGTGRSCREGDGRLLFGEVPSVLDRHIGRDDLSEGVGALTTDWRR
jgi:hypothetical protein